MSILNPIGKAIRWLRFGGEEVVSERTCRARSLGLETNMASKFERIDQKFDLLKGFMEDKFSLLERLIISNNGHKQKEDK